MEIRTRSAMCTTALLKAKHIKICIQCLGTFYILFPNKVNHQEEIIIFIIIIIIIVMIILLQQFFTSAIPSGLSLEFKRQRVSSSLPDYS